MNADRINQALHKRFHQDGERLVFWHDEKGEFRDYVTNGLGEGLESIRVLQPAEMGGFSSKLLLEKEAPTDRFLVYTTGTAPPPEEDWLLDIRLYSSEFHADIASVWMQELGLESLSLRDYLGSRSVFLNNQERRRKLKPLVTSHENPESLDLKMIAVMVGSPIANTFDVLRVICHQHAEETQFDLGAEPKVMASLAKMQLLDHFWNCCREEFGYQEESPTVARLVRRLFISELLHNVGEPLILELNHHRLPGKGAANALVFLTQWRDSHSMGESYDIAAAKVAQEQRIGELVSNLELDRVRDVFTFWDVEGRLLAGWKDRLLDEAEVCELGLLEEVAGLRKVGHWLSNPNSEKPERLAASRAYDALVSAAELFHLGQVEERNLHFDSAQAGLEQYRTKLYRLDRLYRQFCTNANYAASEGWDLLKVLGDKVDAFYNQRFLRPLGVEWSRHLDNGFLQEWKIPRIRNQERFFRYHIDSHLGISDRKRAFVIISDAFRFEAALELTQTLKGRYGMDAETEALLGALPSYTDLGMASLLPHKTLSFDKKGNTLVDGKRLATTEARGAHLESFDGMACQADRLRKMKSEEARKFTNGKRVVYIYHNVIDDRGENKDSETFEAVNQCIEEIQELVQFCINKLNASKIWITADHGFLFRRVSPEETDKSKLDFKPKGMLKAKNRYLIGNNLGETPEVHHGRLSVTANASDAMEFWVPKGANQFKFTGGGRFFHGGAMPQEILVPVVIVSQLRGKKRETSGSEKVTVQVLGSNHKITTPNYRFEIIQTEAVGEKRLPMKARVAIYDNDIAVTSIESVAFESDSHKVDDRKKSVRLQLKTGTFDKKKQYRLVLRDAETEAVVHSLPVVIDRSFDDDF